MKIRFAVPLVAMALTFSMSACGSDSGDAASDAASGAPTSLEEVEKELKERGYETKKNEDGTTTVTGGGGGTELTKMQQESMKKVIACMRAKGYDMPELDPTNPVVAPKNTDGMDPAKVNKDSQECAKQSMPQGG